MTLQNLLLCLASGFLSNVITELFLTFDLKHSFTSLMPTYKCLRTARWISCWVGLILVGLFNSSPLRLLVVALFTVSASTDLETRFLPPDWFVYGAVVISCLCGYATDGLPGLRAAIVAQAVCFVAMVFGILVAGVADSGDIKLLMQYGSACGALPVVGVGITVEFFVRLVILVIVISMLVAKRHSLCEAFGLTARLKMPHGPVAWIGLVVAVTVLSPSFLR